MSPTDTPNDDVEPIVERAIHDMATFTEYLSVWLGLELGLYHALAAGPATSHVLARRAGIAERYAREWLEHQTVAGYLRCEDPAAEVEERRFELPSAVAAVLIEPESGAFLGPLFTMARGMMGVMDDLLDAYRTGEGVPYAAYGEGIRHGIGSLNGPMFDSELAAWLGAVPGLDDRLRSSEQPRILDLGCGSGRSTLALARAYPRATVRGVDLDPASVEEARKAAADAGLAHRVTFARTDAARIGRDTPYDLVTILEALHDMGDPVGALRAVRSVLADAGSVYIADERVADQFGPDAEMNERLQYGFSVLHCLPATLAENPTTANGTVLRMPTLVAWAREAGFDTVEDLQIEDLFWRHYHLQAGPSA